MTDLEHIQQLMAELGPATDAIATVAEGPDGRTWAIEMEDEAVVEVELNAELGKLALTAVLPKPDANRRVETCEALLTFNFLWQDASPVRMAMDEPGGRIIQVAELPTTTLDIQGLQVALADFVHKAALWREAIAAGCAPAAQALVFESLGAHALRV